MSNNLPTPQQILESVKAQAERIRDQRYTFGNRHDEIAFIQKEIAQAIQAAMVEALRAAALIIKASGGANHWSHFQTLMEAADALEKSAIMKGTE